MKAMISEKINTRWFYKDTGTFLAFLMNIIFCLSGFHLTAQNTTEASSKKSFTLNVSAIVTNDNRSINIRASRKENKKTILIDDIKTPFNLYLNAIKEHDPTDGTGWIAKAILNNEGEGVFNFPPDFYSKTSGLKEFTFIVTLTGNPVYEDVEESLTVSGAKIKIEFIGDDSVKTVTGTLLAWKDSGYVPVPEAELKLGIKRSFNYLLFSEAGALTDENGQVSGTLPLDIPGNANGTLTITGRLEDDGTFGTVETTSTIPWAILPKINEPRGRTLWSSGDNAPLLLVISSISIIIIIWSIIFYLIYLLFKIKKLGKTP